MGSECKQTLDALDTSGGFNQRLREHMTGTGMADALNDGLDRLEKGL